MGIFQSITHSFFIAKCVIQVKDVLPDSAGFAEQFCADNAKELSRARSDGFSVVGCVNMLCMWMLDTPARYMRDSRGSENLIIASNYALAFMARWPNDAASRSLKEALENFSAKVDKHPLVKNIAA